MHLSVHLLCYLLINHWTKFNQIWCVCVCVTLMKLAPNGKKNIWPYPLGIGQISFSFKDFYTKLCVCSYKRKIQNISVGIFILSPGPCPRGETPLCYILINHWTKFKQFWCVCVCVCVYSHKWGTQWQNILALPPWGPRERSKGQISFNFKIFIPNFVCVLTNERYKTYQSGFFFCRLGHALGVELGVLRCLKSNSVLLSV